MDKGTIYLVSTPIGNLEDITLRALRVLKEVEVVYAEDTRSARVLFSHFGVQKKAISFFEGNQDLRMRKIKEMLLEGKSIAVISEAGTPGIADPGESLVQLAIKEQFPLVFVPGASAVINSLIPSGLSTEQFIFLNFPPRKKSERVELFRRIKGLKMTSIFFESKRRVLTFLQEAIELFGPDHPAVVARELTKKFEEFVRGSLQEVYLDISQRKELLGEVVILLGGVDVTREIPQNITEVINSLLKEYSLKEACKLVASKQGLRANDIYRQYIKDNK
ncbi:MAG: Ribosomal RNA small subunit methyltransferase I [candidate division WS2 bacterium]|nr:Ribosomal RNA small subunit methyltransferase I [Candidatus Psychracetigena formicireducens]